MQKSYSLANFGKLRKKILNVVDQFKIEALFVHIHKQLKKKEFAWTVLVKVGFRETNIWLIKKP